MFFDIKTEKSITLFIPIYKKMATWEGDKTHLFFLFHIFVSVFYFTSAAIVN